MADPTDSSPTAAGFLPLGDQISSDIGLLEALARQRGWSPSPEELELASRMGSFLAGFRAELRTYELDYTASVEPSDAITWILNGGVGFLADPVSEDDAVERSD